MLWENSVSSCSGMLWLSLNNFWPILDHCLSLLHITEKPVQYFQINLGIICFNKFSFADFSRKCIRSSEKTEKGRFSQITCLSVVFQLWISVKNCFIFVWANETFPWYHTDIREFMIDHKQPILFKIVF